MSLDMAETPGATETLPRFHRAEIVRFQHCDAAGIVFYPRYVEMINSTVEDWCDHLGFSFAEIHGPMHAAIPVISLQVDFQSPSRLGELLDFELTVKRLGRTSVTLRILASHLSEQRFAAELTLVHINKDDYRPREWPDQMKRVMVAP